MKNNIFLVGFMGAGKSETGKILAKKLNYNFIDSDDIIENKEHKTITEIFKLNGEDYFRNLEAEFIKNFTANCETCNYANDNNNKIVNDKNDKNDKNNKIVNDENDKNDKNVYCVIATGGGMPCSNDNIKFLKDKGAVIYLKARPDTIYERIKETKHRPVLGKRDFSILDIENLLYKREQFYTQADLIIYTDGISPEGVADEIKIFLKLVKTSI